VPFDERGWSDRLSTKMSLRTTIHITPMEDAFAVSRDAGNSPVRFDVAGAGDGVEEPLDGHEAGNGGHNQGASSSPPHRSPTRRTTGACFRPLV
jgi:hypothetical protein